MSLYSKPCTNVGPTYDSFTPEEWSALQRLRTRYQQSADLFNERELTHLQFLRWLLQAGRMVEDGGPAEADGSRAAA